MENELEQLRWAVDRIRAEVSSIAQSIAFLTGLVVVALLVTSCGPEKDVESVVSGCMADATVHHLGSSYAPTCMSGKGYDFTWERDGCGNEVTFYFQDCYEKRGAWRSTKKFGKEAFKWLFPNRKAG